MPAELRVLADESTDFGVVRALRAGGHDVVAVVEDSPGVPDEYVIDLALRSQRILITEDRDFGRLVFAHGHKTIGVIFIRYPAWSRERLLVDVVRMIDRLGTDLVGRFVVLQPGRVRISKTP